MQIETTRRYYCTPKRMGEIKKIVISPNASEGAEKLENSYIASGNAEWKCIWQLIRKLNICIPYDPAMALLKKKNILGKIGRFIREK